MATKALNADDEVRYEYPWKVTYYPSYPWWKRRYYARVETKQFVNGLLVNSPYNSYREKGFWSEAPAVEWAKKTAARLYTPKKEPERKIVAHGKVPL